MKKFTAIILAFAIVLCMGITAFATNSSSGNTTGALPSVDVKAQYINGVTPAGSATYSYVVSWGAMEFSYTRSGNEKWNAGSHDYDVENEKFDWTASGNEITVTNHSDAQIVVAFDFAKGNGFDALTYAFSNDSITLPSAVGKAVDDASLTGSTALTIGGEISDDVTTLSAVGQITITVS